MGELPNWKISELHKLKVNASGVETKRKHKITRTKVRQEFTIRSLKRDAWLLTSQSEWAFIHIFGFIHFYPPRKSYFQLVSTWQDNNVGPRKSYFQKYHHFISF